MYGMFSLNELTQQASLAAGMPGSFSSAVLQSSRASSSFSVCSYSSARRRMARTQSGFSSIASKGRYGTRCVSSFKFLEPLQRFFSLLLNDIANSAIWRTFKLISSQSLLLRCQIKQIHTVIIWQIFSDLISCHLIYQIRF